MYTRQAAGYIGHMLTTTIGDRVRRARLARPGITQVILSQAVGVSRVHIARVECGMRNPSERLIARISHVLDVPLEDMLDE